MALHWKIPTAAVLALALPFATSALEENPDLPGKKADGSILLPNQWRLKPTGTQVDLGDGAVNSALHPDGRYLAVQHAGHSKHEIVVVDLQEAKIASRSPLVETFWGISFSSDGKKLFCSGAGKETIVAHDFADGVLSNIQNFAVRSEKERGIPAGIAVQNDAERLYVANVWGQRVTRVELSGKKETKDIPLINDPNATGVPDVARPEDPDEAAATKRDEALQDRINAAAPFPYHCRLDEKRERLYVSLWAKACVAVIDLKENKELARWKTEDHPCEMLLTKDGKILYVANANRNTVTVLETEAGKALETIWAAMHPDTPPGATPISLALSPDEKTLFVANAGANNVTVIDVEHPGKAESMGFIPAGWYPTSVRVTPDGKTLCVVNGKGITSLPNHPPKAARSTFDYIGSLLKGTLSIIPVPADRSKFKEQMAAWTLAAYTCTPQKVVDERIAKRAQDNPIPAKVGDPSPIKYVIYIIKENRTYDQVLGDLPQGNGNAKICLFPRDVTPNHHKIAEEFVLLDNFYVDGEVSADGHEWTCGAYATDFVEKFWPMSYGHNKLTGKYSYASEGNFPIAAPALGYLWDRAKEANISYRSYGEFVANPKTPDGKCTAKVKTLEGHIDEHFRSFDMTYSDLKRADRFISELKRFETEDEMPQLQILRLPNDHTHGTGAGRRTPTAFVAENDLAFGMVLEALTKSKFWPKMAVFCVEDDAQNGPDHVDAHRTIAFVASPYCKRKFIDSSMYSTSSMLRTMELILGLKPNSQFDAAALPMFHCFQATPDATPYAKLDANVDIDAKNRVGAYGSEESLKMAFDQEDAADDLALNEVIWRSVKGADSPMPAPVRAAFVFTHEKVDDDDGKPKAVKEKANDGDDDDDKDKKKK